MAKLNIEEMFRAMKSLTGAGFKLYIYNRSKAGPLKETPAMAFTGLSRSAYYRAMNEQGYIIESEDKIDFYETSQEEL